MNFIDFIVKTKILKLNSRHYMRNAVLKWQLQQVEKKTHYNWSIKCAPLFFSKLFEICESFFFLKRRHLKDDTAKNAKDYVDIYEPRHGKMCLRDKFCHFEIL